MNTKDIVQSIGDKITAIDLKLERFLDNGDREAKANFETIKSFIEEMTQIVSIKLTGELPIAIELLEKKIDSFDIHLADSLKIFGRHLQAYEKKLEERIINEFEELNNNLIERINHHQVDHAERLEQLGQSIDKLSNAIGGLYRHQTDFDAERLAQVLEDLNANLEKQREGKKSRRGFLNRKK